MRRLCTVICHISCISAMLMSFASQVSAWKAKTHIYSANMLIDEVASSNGYVEIAPYGKFAVLPEYRDAIQMHPDSFRAGAVGFDYIPDFYVGKAFIHPFSPNIFLDSLWRASEAIRYDAELATAYVLGAMVHTAGDYFANSWTSKWAEGTWPAVTGMMSPEEEAIIARHSAIESYIDSKIPQGQLTKAKYSLRFPTQFIRTVMVDNLDVYALSSSSFPVHLELFNELKRLIAAQTKKSVAAGEFFKRWTKAIDDGLDEWLRVNIKYCEEASSPQAGARRGLSQLTRYEYEQWALSKLPAMLSGPDSNGDFTSIVWDVVQSLPPHLGALHEQMHDVMVNGLFEAVYGSLVDEIDAIDANPSAYLKDTRLFKAGIAAKIDSEMDNFPKAASAVEQSFSPLHNSLVLAKLSLIGAKGLEELAKRAGDASAISGQRVQSGSLLLPAITNLVTGFSYDKPDFSQYPLWADSRSQAIAKQIFALEGTAPRPRLTGLPSSTVLIASPGPTRIEVKYESAPKGAKLGLYPAVPSSQNSIGLGQINQGSGLHAIYLPAATAAGKYQFRMITASGSTIAVSQPIQLNAKPVSQTGSLFGKPTLTGAPKSAWILPGESEGSKQCSITYAQVPQGMKAVIGLFNSATGRPLHWSYTSGTPRGSYTAVVPFGTLPGLYNFRLYDETGKLLASTPDFKVVLHQMPYDVSLSLVTKSPVELPAKSSIGQVRVAYSGIPAGQEVFVGLYKAPVVTPIPSLPWQRQDGSQVPPQQVLTTQSTQVTQSTQAAGSSAVALLLGKGLDAVSEPAAGPQDQRPSSIDGTYTDGSPSGTINVKITPQTPPGEYHFRVYDSRGVLLAFSDMLAITARKPQVVQVSEQGATVGVPVQPGQTPLTGKYQIGPEGTLIDVLPASAAYTAQRIKTTEGWVTPGRKSLLLTVAFRLVNADRSRYVEFGGDSLGIQAYDAKGLEIGLLRATLIKSSEPLVSLMLLPAASQDITAVIEVPDDINVRSVKVWLNEKPDKTANMVVSGVPKLKLQKMGSVASAMGTWINMDELDLRVDYAEFTRQAGIVGITVRNATHRPVPLGDGFLESTVTYDGATQAQPITGWTLGSVSFGSTSLGSGYSLLPGREISLKASFNAPSGAVPAALVVGEPNSRLFEFKRSAWKKAASAATTAASRKALILAGSAGESPDVDVTAQGNYRELTFTHSGVECSMLVEGVSVSLAATGDDDFGYLPMSWSKRATVRLSLENRGDSPVDVNRGDLTLRLVDDGGIARYCDGPIVVGDPDARVITLEPGQRVYVLTYSTLPRLAEVTSLVLIDNVRNTVNTVSLRDMARLENGIARDSSTKKATAVSHEQPGNPGDFLKSGYLDIRIDSAEYSEDGRQVLCYLTLRGGYPDEAGIWIGITDGGLAVRAMPQTQTQGTEADEGVTVASVGVDRQEFPLTAVADIPSGAAITGVWTSSLEPDGSRGYWISAQ